MQTDINAAYFKSIIDQDRCSLMTLQRYLDDKKK